MTNRLDRGERAVLLIGGVSLLTAVVCFGILESTGTFKNPVYSIGGSLVGFLAAATLLYRIYLGAEQSQIPASERRRAPFVFEEVVKVLDLRTSGKLVPGVG